MSLYEPIIKDYQIQNRILTIENGIFNHFKKDLSLYYWSDEEMYIRKCVKIYGFGALPFMNGKACCSFSEISKVHDYLKNLFLQCYLSGSVVINRSTLNYSHFVLDFDMKNIKCDSYEVVNTQDYKEYIKARLFSREKAIMNNNSNIDDKSSYKTNYFVYEIIYFITHILRIDWLPIYIFGKGQTFNNGFHIEIPDLIMSYHDIALLSFACNNFIPNKTILDSPINYSVLGSQKIQDTKEKTIVIKEIESTYLPYLKFYDQQFSDAKTFSLTSLFDQFNILKPINPKAKVYGFKLFRNINSNASSDNDIYNLIYFHPSENKIVDDETIPESIHNNNNNDDNDDNNNNFLPTIISTKLMTLLENNPHNNNINNESNLLLTEKYLIGNLEFSSFLHYTNKINIYKTLLLNQNEDFVYYQDIPKTYLKYNNLLPNHSLSIKRNNLTLNVKEIPLYYTQNMMNSNVDIKSNFTNNTLKDVKVKIYYENNNNTKTNTNNNNDNIFYNFFHPFTLKHFFKLINDNEDRMRNTVYYLFSIYMLSEKIKPINSFIQKWLYNLGLKNELINFLNIFYIIKSKLNENLIHFTSNDLNWAMLCLKHLLITNNVIKIEELRKEGEGATIYQPFYNNPILLGAVKEIQIPDIVLNAIMLETTEMDSLISLCYPIIKKDIKVTKNKSGTKKNNGSKTTTNMTTTTNNNNNSIMSNNLYNQNDFLLWNNDFWNVVNMMNLKNFFLASPDLTHIAKLCLSIEEQYEKKGKPKPNYNGVLTGIINKILVYWQDMNTAPTPSYFWKMNDCYFLLGGRDLINGGLISILPLPMYHDISSSIETSLNSYEINDFIIHMETCGFIQNQLFPIMRNEIKKEYHQSQKEKNNKYLRRIIDSRNDYTNEPDLETQITMEIEKGVVFTQTLSSINHDVVNDLWGEKRKLTKLTRNEYHIQRVKDENNDELIKLVKYFIIDQMSTSYKDMRLFNVKENIVNEYVKETPKEKLTNKDDRIIAIAHSLYENLKGDPHTAILCDIEPEEITKMECRCVLTTTLFYLLQTFSYDIMALRFVLSKIITAIYYGINLHEKHLYLFLGDTNSGKTQFLKLLTSVLGNMSGIISPRTSYHGTHQDRIHDIGRKAESARLWYMDEIGNKEFNRQFFNQITGNSPLFIRTNYSQGEMIQVAPMVFIFGNNSPVFNENCPALINRLRFFTFRSEFNPCLPICFKYSKFPQLTNFEKNHHILVKGLTAILLHAMCYCNVNSPLYLYGVILELPRNIEDSTVMNSPMIRIVREMLQKCDIVEEPSGFITVKRIVHLINNLNVLKMIKVSSATDALRFLDYFYPRSELANDNIVCEDAFKELASEHTTVYQGIMERDVSYNNEKILKNK